ncbi:hypothetical protein ABK040_010951 [Willaertia magna]
MLTALKGSSNVALKLTNKLNNNLMIMKKVIPNRNKQVNNPITSFRQIRSYTTTTNWLKKKEVLNVGKCGTSTLIPKHQIDLNDYKRWNAQQVKYVLTSDQSSGGAGLSIEKVESFYETGFDGSSLSNIVENIKRRTIKEAVNRLARNFNKDASPQLLDACKTIVYWVNTNLIPLIALQEMPKVNNEAIKQARTDPKYEYLRNLHDTNKMIELERLIGTNIDLPVLGLVGSEHVPKNYNPESKYLFTRQTFDILKNVVNRKEEGYVLSGPFGISKSYTMYLIACYAIVNSIPLLYVPRCLNWVGRYFEQKELGANEYLRNLLFFYNGDIFPLSLQRELIISSTNVIETLKIYYGRNVFLLFDEHHELFGSYANGQLFSDLSYFRNFTRWTGVTSGAMTIYCGSAHSLFEDNLPGGTESYLINIIPPTIDEFKTLVKNFGLNPDDKRIEIVTGRIPGELVYFAKHFKGKEITDESVTDFMLSRSGAYYRRILKLNSNQQQELLRFLDELFSLNLRNGRPKSISGCCYDLGLLYRAQDSNLYCINNAAASDLWKFYCNQKPLNAKNAAPVNQTESTIKGLTLEGTGANCDTYKVLCDAPKGKKRAARKKLKKTISNK